MNFHRYWLACVLFLAPGACVFAAYVPGAAVSGGSSWSDRDTTGWRFEVLESIFVGSLGVWDDGDDGLSAPVAVGLWDDGGTLLASVTVPAGLGGDLISGFRYAQLTDKLPLAAGAYYRVGASAQTGELAWLYNVDKIVTIPEIVYDAGYFADVADNLLTFPGVEYPKPPASGLLGLFGANLLIPAPGVNALLLAGLLGALMARGMSIRSRVRPEA